MCDHDDKYRSIRHRDDDSTKYIATNYLGSPSKTLWYYGSSLEEWQHEIGGQLRPYQALPLVVYHYWWDVVIVIVLISFFLFLLLVKSVTNIKTKI